MPDLRDWIEAQLKRGYSRKQIKSALIRKGYSPKAVAEVDKIGFSALAKKQVPEKFPSKPIAFKDSKGVIAGVDNKLPVKSIGIAILVIAIAVGIYYMYGYKAAEETSGISKSILNPSSFCDKFKGIDYNISCDKAVELALVNARGIVQNISIGSGLARDPDTRSMKIMDMWLVDIKLEDPYFDEVFKREVHLLRIGIGLKKHFSVYREVLA